MLGVWCMSTQPPVDPTDPKKSVASKKQSKKEKAAKSTDPGAPPGGLAVDPFTDDPFANPFADPFADLTGFVASSNTMPVSDATQKSGDTSADPFGPNPFDDPFASASNPFATNPAVSNVPAQAPAAVVIPKPPKKQALHEKLLREDLGDPVEETLLSKADIAFVKQYLLEHKNDDPPIRKLKRTRPADPSKGKKKVPPLKLKDGTELELKRSVIVDENDPMHGYALYKGKKQVLGGGSYGKVKIGQDLNTGELVAVKIQKNWVLLETVVLNTKTGARTVTPDPDFSKESKKLNKTFKREAGFEKSEGTAKASLSRREETRTVLELKADELEKYKTYAVQKDYIILKLGKKDLDHQRDDIVGFDAKLKVAISAFKALKKLHDKNLIHRDIKPGNMLWENDEISLIDLGMIIDLNKAQVRGKNVRTENGVLQYHSKRFDFDTVYRYWPTESVSAKEGNWFSKSSDVYGMAVSLMNKDDLNWTKELFNQSEASISRSLYERTQLLMDSALSEDPAVRPSVDVMLQEFQAIQAIREKQIKRGAEIKGILERIQLSTKEKPLITKEEIVRSLSMEDLYNTNIDKPFELLEKLMDQFDYPFDFNYKPASQLPGIKTFLEDQISLGDMRIVFKMLENSKFKEEAKNALKQNVTALSISDWEKISKDKDTYQFLLNFLNDPSVVVESVATFDFFAKTDLEAFKKLAFKEMEKRGVLFLARLGELKKEHWEALLAHPMFALPSKNSQKTLPATLKKLEERLIDNILNTNHLPLIKALVGKGYDLKINDETTFTRFKEHPEILEWIVDQKDWQWKYNSACEEYAKNTNNLPLLHKFFKNGYIPNPLDPILPDYIKYEHDLDDKKPPLKSLLDAIKTGDAATVKYYLLKGVSSNAMDSSLPEIALAYNQPEIASLFLNRSDYSSINDQYLFSWAADGGNDKVWDVLLSREGMVVPEIIVRPRSLTERQVSESRTDDYTNLAARSTVGVNLISYLLEKGKVERAIQLMQLPQYKLPKGKEQREQLEKDIKASGNAVLQSTFQKLQEADAAKEKTDLAAKVSPSRSTPARSPNYSVSPASSSSASSPATPTSPKSPNRFPAPNDASPKSPNWFPAYESLKQKHANAKAADKAAEQEEKPSDDDNKPGSPDGI